MPVKFTINIQPCQKCLYKNKSKKILRVEGNGNYFKIIVLFSFSVATMVNTDTQPRHSGKTGALLFAAKGKGKWGKGRLCGSERSETGAGRGRPGQAKRWVVGGCRLCGFLLLLLYSCRWERRRLPRRDMVSLSSSSSSLSSAKWPGQGERGGVSQHALRQPNDPVFVVVPLILPWLLEEGRLRHCLSHSSHVCD